MHTYVRVNQILFDGLSEMKLGNDLLCNININTAPHLEAKRFEKEYAKDLNYVYDLSPSSIENAQMTITIYTEGIFKSKEAVASITITMQQWHEEYVYEYATDLPIKKDFIKNGKTGKVSIYFTIVTTRKNDVDPLTVAMYDYTPRA